MEKIELICIGCPMGCPLTVELEDGAVTKVTGNTCPRGDAYGRKEVTNPTRIVTSTVRVTGGTLPAVSCKTRSDVPKGKIFDVVRALPSRPPRPSPSGRCCWRTPPAPACPSSPPKTWRPKPDHTLYNIA